jgi:hypothetical protein
MEGLPMTMPMTSRSLGDVKGGILSGSSKHHLS